MRAATLRHSLIVFLCILMILMTSSAQTETGLAELVAGNNTFAFDFYQAIAPQSDGNLIFSPYSISQALAMTYAGARGNTETQMRDTLHFTLPQATLHPAFWALHTDLMSRGTTGADAESPSLQLYIANALWGQQGYPFLPDYLALVQANYGAGLIPVDFAGAPEESRLQINDWVAEQTEDRILDLIPPGIIDGLTRLVLTNAVYFKTTWLYPFDPAATQEAPFTLLDNSTVSVPTMTGEQMASFADSDECQAIELPYYGENMAMLILLPPEKVDFAEFEASLNAQVFADTVQGLQSEQIQLFLPRFEYESEWNLSDTLKEMGMPEAFEDGAADFTGMTGTRDLAISAVLHKAFIGVDESGTEAAAATAVIMGTRSAAMPMEVHIDRPFVFIIYDKPTQTILFIGRVLNPAE